jgi:hypothetical protein
MVNVCIFSDFCSSEDCRAIFDRIWPSNSKLTWVSGGPFTHAILLNHASPRLFLPKETVVGFAYEPPELLQWKQSQVKYVKETCGLYCVGSTGNTTPFMTNHGYLWHLGPLANPLPKTKLMSIILSEKQWAPGHAYRHALVSAILKTDLPIDIFGRGCPEGSDPRLKGKFSEREPYDNYTFHIAIENYQTVAYFSEKISNCLMTNTTPIYLGASSLPFEDSVVRLHGVVEDDIQLLQEIVKHPETYQKELDLVRLQEVLDVRVFLESHWNLV